MSLGKIKGPSRGFSLIELLVVITLIIILSGLVYVNLRPAERFSEARNAKRTTAVYSLLSTIHQYIIDNEGALPPGLGVGMAERQLGTAGNGCATFAGAACGTESTCLDLSTPLAKYLSTIPKDPSVTESGKTGYTVKVNNNGIVTIRSCNPEGGVTIKASR